MYLIVVLCGKDLERLLGGENGAHTIGAQPGLAATGPLDQGVLPGDIQNLRIAPLVQEVALLVAEDNQKVGAADEVIEHIQVWNGHLAKWLPLGDALLHRLVRQDALVPMLHGHILRLTALPGLQNHIPHTVGRNG